MSLIKDIVKKLCIDANCVLGEDVIRSLKTMADLESSGTGREIIGQLIENADIAAREGIPMCQDTGFAVVFLEIGQEVCFTGGSITDAINAGVREGYFKGYLRKSIVGSPLTRVNTGDNAPAVIHTEIVEGEKVKVIVAPKGGGSENMSAVKMLKPAEGRDGIKRFVLETVIMAGPNPCPPIVVGVGIGGTMEKAAIMSKYALTRTLGEHNQDSEIAQLEKELLAALNGLGIGPQGMGGKTTALAVHIEQYATHIACLPVAVNIGCHAYRHMSAVI